MNIQSVSQFSSKKHYITDGFQNNVSPLDNLLKGMNLAPYNENTESDLLKKQDYAKLIVIQDSINGHNNTQFAGKYVNLPAFGELAQSKYFNTPANFEKLTTIVSVLEQKKQNAVATVSSPFYRPCAMPDVMSFQAKTDVGECVNNINKFFKSNFSDDLKEYIRDNTDMLTDLKKTSINLGYLDQENPKVEYLNDFMFGLM